MTKKKRELEPVIEEKGVSIKKEDFSKLAESMKGVIIGEDISSSDGDSYYREILNKLFDDTDVSTKTEYLNVKENFDGTKLDFYAKFGSMPYLKNFMQTFEKKRISLERKGRKEVLMALQERRQEEERLKMDKLRGMFGV